MADRRRKKNDIEEAKKAGQKALEDAKAGKIQRVESENEVRGFAEIPYLQGGNSNFGDTSPSVAIDTPIIPQNRDISWEAEQRARALEANRQMLDYYHDVMREENASRNAQRRGEAGQSEVLGARKAPGEKTLTAKAQNEIDSMDREIKSLERSFTGDAGVDEVTNSRINDLKRQKESVRNAGRSKNDYMVTREDYTDKMQDPEFANDLSKLTKILYNQRGAGGIATVNATSEKLTGKKYADYVADLSKKYDLSETELRDMALTMHSDDRQGYVDERQERARQFGEAHPVLGSIASLGETLGDSVEGYYNNLAGMVTGDDRRLSNAFKSTKEGMREGVKENLGTEGRIARLEKYNPNGINDRKIAALKNRNNPEAAKVAYDLLMSLGDLGVGVATGNAPLTLAGATANDAMLGAIDRGQSTRKAALYGTGAGVVDYITNTIGLDYAKGRGMEKIAASGIEGLKQYLVSMGVSAGAEAGENLIQNLTQTVLDEVINKDRSETQTNFRNRIANGESEEEAFKNTLIDKGKEILMEIASGAVMGAGMYGGTALSNRIKGGKIQDILNENSRRVWEKVNADKEARARQEMEVPESVEPQTSMDPAHEIASRYAATYSAYDDYDSMDNVYDLDGFIEGMADDIENGRDLSKYIEALEDAIDEAPDEEIRASMESLIDDLSAISENPVDNSINPAYADGVNGGVVNGREIDRAGNQGSIGSEEPIPGGEELSPGMDGGRSYTGEDGRTFNLRDVVDNELSKRMDEAGINNFGLRDTTGQAEDFSRQLAEAKANNTNGRMVSGKTPEELTDAILFSDDARTCGVAIEPDGNIVAVHKNPSNKQRGAVDDMLITARVNGGDRLDCYGRGLVRKYEQDGFTPVARVEWNEKFRPDDWGDNPPEEIYVMMKDARSNEQVLDDIKNGVAVNKTSEELDNLPYFSIAEYGDDAYDEALKYRDSLIDEAPGNGAFSNEAVNYPTPPDLPQVPTQSLDAIARVEGPTPPNNNVPPVSDRFNGGGDKSNSKFVTNTAVKAGIVGENELETNPELAEIALKDVHHNDELFNEAQQNVSTKGQELLKGYLDGSREIKTDLEFARAMILMQNGDLTEPERNVLISKIVNSDRDFGEYLQAHKMFANTADAALIKAGKIDAETTDKWKSVNKKQLDDNNRVAKAIKLIGVPEKTQFKGAPLTHEELKAQIVKTINDAFGADAQKFNDEDIEYLTILAETKKVPIRKITDEIEHKLETGKWFTLDESKPVKKPVKNEQVLDIVDRIANGGLPKQDKGRNPVSYSRFLTKIRNSLKDPSHGLADEFNDLDAYYIGKMLEARVPKETIEAQIRNRLETGEWSTLDEALPIKEEKVLKNGMLYNMLDRVMNGEKPKVEKEPEAYGTFLAKIRNSLKDDSLGIADKFDDTDVYFLGQLIQANVPKKTIEAELQHKLETGEWFTIDESIPAPKPTSQKLQNAFKQMRGEATKSEPQPKTFNQIREEVRNTLEKNDITDYTDEDVDYVANLIEKGASTADIAEALNTKAATGRFGVKPETQSQINELFQYARQYGEDSQEFVEAQAEAYRLLAEEVAPDAAPLEKFDTWRYMAMLGNPKTMLRNFVGNKMFSAVTGVSNNLAALLEHGADFAYNKATGEHIQRTKEFLNPVKDSGLIDRARQDAYNEKYRQIAGPKYEKLGPDSLKRYRSVFNSDVMRLAEKAVDAGISDTKAVANKYATSLAGYMKANGLDETAFDDAYTFEGLERLSRNRDLLPDEVAELNRVRDIAARMEKARDYALKQAEYATFHEDNKVADWISHAAQTAPGWRRHLIEGIIPFKRTPFNILKSGEQFSPLGAIESIAKTGKLIYENTGRRKGNLADEYKVTGKFTGHEYNFKRTLASDVIESWAKTITGSALTYLGYYLFSKGILTSSEKGEKYQDQLEGKENYAININGHTYTLDWAAPGVMPLLLGAEIKKVFTANGKLDEDWYSDPERWLQTINGLFDPILETSFLSGIKDTLEAAARPTQYDEEGNIPFGIIGSVIGNALTGYATQGIPTLAGQLARTIDPIRRTTDTYSSNPLAAAIEQQARKAMNKIPFLSMLNTPYVDARGEQQLNGLYGYEKGDTLGNIAKFRDNLVYQMLSPGYYSDIKQTPGDIKGREIYNGLDEQGKPIKDDKVFADWRNTKKINGEKLDPKQMYTFRTEMGTANRELRNMLAESDWFNELDATKQNEIFKSLNTIADKIGQNAVMPGSVKIEDELKAYVDAGGGEEGFKAIISRLRGQDLVSQSGVSASSNIAKAIKAANEAGDTELAEELTNAGSTLVEMGVPTRGQSLYADRGHEYLPQLSPEEYGNAYLIADKSGDGKISQEELKESFAELGVKTTEQAQAYWKGLLNSYTEGSTQLPVVNADGSISYVKPTKEETEPEKPQEITTLDPAYQPSAVNTSQYNTIDSVIDAMANAGLNTSAAKGYWNQASSVNSSITPGEFYQIYNAIDSSLGAANGAPSKDEWVSYLNNNEYDEAGDRDMINMMYNTGWKPLKYNNGKWSK